MKPFPAAVLATREIGMAVLATTLSLMAVFIPVSFMPGIAGRFLRSFGLTMAFAIAVSLLVSFSLTPSLAARWLKSHPLGVERKPSFLERGVEVFYRPIERVYMSVLRWIMGHRWVMVIACIFVMGSCVPIAKSLPGGFLPVDDIAQFEINLRAPEGTSLTATRLVTERITDDVKRIPGVEHTLTTIGAGNTQAPNVVTVLVMLVDPDKRTQSQSEIMQRVRDEVLSKQPPEMHASAGEVQIIGGGGAANSAHIQVALQGPDLKKLSAHATHLTEAMKKVPGAVDIDNTFVVGKPQVRASVLRDRAADLGVQVADVAGTLQLLVGGLKVSSYSEGGEEYDIRMRADAKFRGDADSLMSLTVPSSKLGSLALSNVISMNTETGPAEINRLGRRRVITVYGNAAPGVGDSTVQTALDKAVAEEHLEAGYSAAPSGRSKDTANTGIAFLVVIGLAFVFMYLILAAQFESWLHPITILLSLPLTVPFALISLHLFHETLNLFSGLGLLVLFGVVKKNAILQIDHTNHLRTEGRNRLDAILEANKDRLRPILMTTIAFVAGMIPLVNSHGVGSGQNRTTGAIVLGGQSLSLALTLLAVPVAYSFFDDLAQWFRRIRRGKTVEDKGEKELDALLGVTPVLDEAAAAEEE
jgi:multidrug efflux pump subunit AcrB